MAKEYAKVLLGMNVPFDVIGRGEKNAAIFEEEFKVKTYSGGLEKFIENNDVKTYSHVINSVSIEALKATTLALLEQGVTNILLEKPGVATVSEIEPLLEGAKMYPEAKIVLAYNRRFYASVQKAKEIIAKDGGVNSMTFEFTEWAHVIKNYDFSDVVLQNWFLGNSTHVIDTAFYLAGEPREMSCYRKGSLDWHTTGSTYTGSGITEKEVLFSYHANWEGPGRWFLELITAKHRLIFKPFEKLQIQEIGSVQVSEVPVDYSLEEDYKPGLFNQTRAFLDGELDDFCTLDEQHSLINKVYNKISGYC